MINKLLLLPALALIIIISAAEPSPAEMSAKGLIRNDVIVLMKNGKGAYGNILDNRLFVTGGGENWKFVSDMRLYLYDGLYRTIAGPSSFTLMRSFIRYDAGKARITAGKTYINFGVRGVFNPFEIRKSLDFSDLSSDNDGMNALCLDAAFSDLAGMKVYLSADTESLTGGVGILASLAGWDAGAMAARTGLGRNKAGFYFKGDALAGLGGAYALHFDDEGKNAYSEASVRADYSFGKLIAAADLYYNEAGAASISDYAALSIADSYLKARQYGHAGLYFTPDEFSRCSADSFFNFTDGSEIIIISYGSVIANGLEATLMAAAFTGEGASEFSRAAAGDYTVLFRIEGKF